MNKNLLLKILELTLKVTDLEADYLQQITDLDYDHLLTFLGNQGYVKDQNEEVKIDSNFRINLAIFGIVNLNLQPHQITKYLTWQEFEEFCFFVLEKHEYSCIRNFRFSKKKKRFEIDLLGFRQPYILSIDAKRWRTRIAKISALKNAVEKQIVRSKNLSEVFSNYSDRFPVTDWKFATFIPILITSMSEGIKSHMNVPIVPFFQFNEFISNLHKNIEDLPQFKIKIKKRGVQTKLYL
ncbi:MAG: hypothetical protein ACTSRG_01295 [Candidatus Helarchaeota archaeon]